LRIDVKQLTSTRLQETTPWRPYVQAWAVVAIGLALTAAVAWRMAAQVREQDEIRFQRLVRQTSEAIRDRFERYEAALEGLADYISLRPTLTPAEWRFRIRLLWPEQKYPGLLEVGFFEIHALDSEAAGANRASATPASAQAAEGDLRLVRSWVRPPSATDGISEQFLDDPAIRTAAVTALRDAQPVRVYRRELSAEMAGDPAFGFTVLVPVFLPAQANPLPNARDASAEETLRSQAQRSRCVVFGSIVPPIVLENLFGNAPREVGFELFSTPTPTLGSGLNARGAGPLTLRPTFDAYLRTNFTLHFPAHEWSVEFHTTQLFERESARYRTRTALAVGTVLTALTGALMFTQIRARLRQEAITAELRLACDDLQRVQNERERLGRDLHDGAIQSLYGLQLSLGQYERHLPRDPEAARGILARCRASVDGLLAELRTYLVQHLPGEDDPTQMGNTGAALQQIVHRFQVASRVPIELVLQDSPPTPVTLGQQLHLRQVAQEAISNSLRHGRARHIKVRLRRENQHLQLRVADDGTGFDAGQSRTGQGLANMQARAVQLGGQLRIQSQPGHGTEIILDVPLAAEVPEPNGKDT
jgi:signal transduction histidine kinase